MVLGSIRTLQHSARQSPTSCRLQFYDPVELLRAPPVVDHQQIAEDVERFTGIPADVANRVLDTELSHLEMRGMTS